MLIVATSFLAPYIPPAMTWTFFGLGFGIVAALFGTSVCLSAFRMRKLQAAARVIGYGFSASGVDLTQPHASSHLDWSYFRGYFISGDVALLAMPNEGVVIVPRRCARPHDLKDLDTMLAENLKRLK